MNKLNIRKDDMVVVLSGRERGKRGKVLRADPAGGKVVIEGVNMVKRHKKPRRQGDVGGILTQEAPILACKVMRLCPKCNTATRTAHSFLEDGSKSRVCKKCGEMI